MYNNFDYEKYLKNERFTPRNGSKKQNRSRSKNQIKPGSRMNKLPPVPKPTGADFEKYLSKGGYLEKNLPKSQPGSISEIESILNRAQEELSKPKPQPNHKLVTPASMMTSDSTNLMSSMAKRLSHLEKTVQSYRLELKLKNTKILKLQDKLDIYESHLKEEGDKNVLHAVLKKNQKLKNELLKLQGFLESYGIRWKGIDELTSEELEKDEYANIDTENFQVNQLMEDINNNQYESKFRTYLPKEISLQTLANRIDDLNKQVLKENPKKFKQIDPSNPKMMRLESSLSKPLHIIFYANSVHLETFPPFTYGGKDAIALLTDLMDGYFPRQLEKSHPDGILLELIDRLDEIKAGAGVNRISSHGKDNLLDTAKGVKIGGNEQNADENDRDKPQPPVRNVKIKPNLSGKPLNQLVQNFSSLQDKRGREMSKDEFLGKLPSKVIKDGKIIEVRDQISKKLGMDSKGYDLKYYDKFILNQPKEDQSEISASKPNLESSKFEEISAMEVFKQSPQVFEGSLEQNRRLHLLSANHFLIKNSLTLTHGYSKIQEMDLGSNKLCAIKLRFEGLESTLVYYEEREKKMQCLVECLELLFNVENGGRGGPCFRFIQNFPRKELEFDSDKDTFEGLGLSPRAALYLKFE